MRRSPWARSASGGGPRRIHRARWPTPPRSSGAGAPERALRRRHGPDLRTRRAERLRAGGSLREAAAELRRQNPDEYIPGARWHPMAAHVRAMITLKEAERSPSTMATTSGPGPGRRSAQRLPTFRGSCPLSQARSLRGQGAVPVGRALGRSGGHLATGRADPGVVPGERIASAMDRDGAGPGAVPGPAGPGSVAPATGMRARARGRL